MKKEEGSKKLKADIYLKELQNKLKYYRQVVIDSSDAIIIQDFNGIIKAWNKGAERIYGFKEKEMLGHNITKIICKEDRAEAKRNIHSIKNGKPSFIIKQARITKDKKKVFVNITYSPIYDLEEVVEIATTEEDVSRLKKSLEDIKNASLKYKQLFDYMSEAVVIYEVKNNGRDIIIKDINGAGEKLEKVNKKDIVGKKVDVVFAGVKEFGLYDVFKKVWKTGRPAHHPISFYEDKFRRAWRENYVFRLPGGGVVAIYSDVTQKIEKDKKIEKISNALKVVSKCNEALIHISEEQGLLNEICKIIVNFGGYRFAWIGCAEKNKAKTVRPVAMAGFENGYLRSAKITWADTKLGQGPTGTAIRTGKIVICTDTSIDPKFLPWRTLAFERGYISSISLPFLINGSVGAVSIYASERDAFNKEEIKLLKQLTNDLAYGIKNIRLKNERARSQIMLGESEKKYYELFSRANDAIFIADPRSRKIVDCNKVAEKLTGYSRSEILFMKADELHPKDLLKVAVGGFKKQAERKVEQVSSEVLTKDNKRIPVSINTALVNIGGKKFIQGIFRDISEQKKAEDIIKESEEKFRKIFENSGMGVSLVGLEGRWLKVNKKLCEITGYSEKELLTKAYLQITHPEDVLKTKEFTKELIIGKNKDNFLEKRYINKKGRVIWVHLSVSLIRDQDKKPLYFEVITEDITKQKKTEQALRESEEKYRNLLSNLPKTEYILVHRKGKLLWVNDNVLSFLGRSREKIIGTSIFKYLEKEYQRIVSENIKRRAAGEAVGDYGIKIKNKEGQMVDVVVRGSLINYMGEPAILLVLSDITELTKKDEAILKENKFLDNIIDLNPNPIQIYDKTGKNFRVNKAYMKMFRFPGIKPPLENYNWFNDPVAKKAGLQGYQQLIKKGRVIKFSEMAYNPHWIMPSLPDIDLVFNATAFPIMDSENNLEKFVLMYDDITERKSAENKLKENENKYRSLFNFSNDAIFLMRGDIFVECNQKTLEMFGCKKSEIIGRPPYEFSPLKQLDGRSSIISAKEKIDNALRGRSQFFEWRHLRCDGSEFDAEVSLNKVRFSEKDYILASVRDISDRKRSTEIIKNNEERYRIITDQTGQLVYDYDLASGNMKWAGPIKKVVGYTPKEFELFDIKKWERSIHPKDRSRILRVLSESIKKCKSFNEVYSLRHKNGKYIQVEDHGVFVCNKKDKPYRMLGTVANITELVKKDKELEESRGAILNVLNDVRIEKNKTEILANDLKKFKLAVDNASDDIIITDPKGIILYANSASEASNGYSISEIIGKTPAVWGRQMSKEFYENFWKTIKKEKKLFVGEMTNKRKNGELYIAEVKVSPILNNKREVQFFVGISHDITKAKELDRAKSEFVSVASHQLKTPVSGIKWMLESILQNRENNLTEKQIIDLRDVYEDNEKMINLINDLLNISRIDSGKYATLNLSKTEVAPLVEKALKDLGQFANIRNVKFEFKNELPTNYSLNIDSDRIYQVILNLISNSIKYSRPEGGISKITTAIKNGEFIFSVKDNGIGIPIQNQRHIFEKFYRAENASASQANGSGLGLYIGKYFVESHRGRIWFKSKEDVGTTFAFTLGQDLI